MKLGGKKILIRRLKLNKMKKLTFITTNKHKAQEIAAILRDYGIEIEQVIMEYEESKEDAMEAVSKKAAKFLADKLNKPLIVEDTGLFFKAYNNFPGAQPKFVIKAIGFDGIFRLLKDKDRSAYFKTVIGYCEPGQEPIIFQGELPGKIIEEVIEPETEAMPYDHIFVPEGLDKAVVQLTLEEKNAISQRGKAARKLGEYLKLK